jgi:hypothetical protein
MGKEPSLMSPMDFCWLYSASVYKTGKTLIIQDILWFPLVVRHKLLQSAIVFTVFIVLNSL